MANQHVLVTGGAGYIGSHVCKALKQRGYIPVSYDNYCSGHAGAVNWGPAEQGDICDRARLAQVIETYQPVAIMHFAALIQVGESVTDPARYYHNNVYGSLCLLEEARAHGIKHMVFSSTAAVYGLPDVDLISEDTPKAPINPYGHTKRAMEQMIYDYSAAYGMKHAVLRYFNAAGADPEAEAGSAYAVDTHIVPLLMRVAAGLSPQIKIFGTDYATPDGTAIRDYVHVTDLAQAHILALDHILAGREDVVVNIGTNTGYSVADVIEAARRATGHPIPALPFERRAGDPPVLVADASRARQILGWNPVYSDLDTIMRTAWAWRQKQSRAGVK